MNKHFQKFHAPTTTQDTQEDQCEMIEQFDNDISFETQLNPTKNLPDTFKKRENLTTDILCKENPSNKKNKVIKES